MSLEGEERGDLIEMEIIDVVFTSFCSRCSFLVAWEATILERFVDGLVEERGGGRKAFSFFVRELWGERV